MATSCSSRLEWVPPLAGADPRASEVYRLLESRREVYRLLESFLAEAALSPKPTIAILVAEWGEGKTSIYEAFLAQIAGRYGFTPVYARATSFEHLLKRGGLVKAVLAIASETATDRDILLFLDESEDLLVSEDTAKLFTEGLMELSEAKLTRRLALVVSLTPPAYSKLTNMVDFRCALARLRRRVKIVWVKPIGLRETLDLILGLAKYSHREGLQGFLEKPSQANIIALASSGNLGALAYLYRALVAFSAGKGSRLCSGGAAKLTDSEVIGLLLREKLVVAGVEVEALYEQGYKSIVIVVEKALGDAGIDKAKASILVDKLLTNIAVPSTEVAETLGLTLDKLPPLIESINKAWRKTLAPTYEAKNLIVWARLSHSGSGIPLIGWDGSLIVVEPISQTSNPTEVLMIEPSIVQLLLGSARLTALGFIKNSSDRLLVLRSAFKEYNPLYPLAGILVLFKAVNPNAILEEVRVLGRSSLLATWKLLETRITALLHIGDFRSLSEELEVSILASRHPVLAILLNNTSSAEGSARELEDIENKYMTKIVELRIRPRSWAKIVALGYYVLSRIGGPEKLSKLLGEEGIDIFEKIGLDSLILALEADSILSSLASSGKLYELLRKGIKGIPLVVDNAPISAKSLVLLRTLLAIPQSDINLDVLENYIEAVLEKYPPRPRTRSHILSHARGFDNLHDLAMSLVKLWEKLLAQPAKLITLRYLHPAEKAILKSLELLGGGRLWIPLQKLATFLATSGNGEELNAWLNLLEDRGLIVLDRSKGMVKLAEVDDIKAWISEAQSIANTTIRVDNVWFAAKLYGKTYTASISESASFLRDLITIAKKKLDEEDFYDAARLARIAVLVAKDLARALEIHKQRMKIVNSIIASLRSIGEEIDRLRREAIELGYNIVFRLPWIKNIENLIGELETLLEDPSTIIKEEGIDDKLLVAAGGDLAVYGVYRILIKHHVIGLGEAVSSVRLLESLSETMNTLRYAGSRLREAITKYRVSVEELRRSLSSVTGKGFILKPCPDQAAPRIARIASIRGLKGLQKALFMLAEEFEYTSLRIEGCKRRLGLVLEAIDRVETAIREARTRRKALEDLVAKTLNYLPWIAKELSRLIDEEKNVEKKLEELRHKQTSLDEFLEVLEEAASTMEGIINRYKHIEEEARTLITEKLEIEAETLKMFSKLSAGSEPIDITVNPRDSSLASLLEELEKLKSLKEKLVETLSSRKAIERNLVETYSALLEAKKKYGELVFSEAVKIVSSILGAEPTSIAKNIVRLIELGLLDPKL